MKQLLFTGLSLLIFNVSLLGQTLIWYENFNHSLAAINPGGLTAGGATVTACTQTSVGTWLQTDCIPPGWRTGRLETGSQTDRGRRAAATTQWDRLNSGGSGNYGLEFEPGTTQWGGVMSHGVTLTAGTRYYVEFFYRVPGTSSSQAGTWVIHGAYTNTNVQQPLPASLTQIVSTGYTSTNWNSACFSFTPPLSGTYYVYLRVRNTSASATQKILIDDMSLYSTVSTPPVSCVSVLGVTLADFSASCEGSNTNITWTTDSERNSDHFTLERSFDGDEWERIARINGAGTTSSLNTYTVEDRKHLAETYYRLTQVDFDGKSEMFPPIVVNCNSKTNELLVYPNPNNGSFTVSVNSNETTGEATVFVQDMSGKVILSRNVNVLSGTNTIHFENTTLSQGAYLVSVQGKDNKAFVPVKLIVQ
jgi:hypothetical protein